MTIWTPSDGYFGTLLSALLGRADRRTEGKQESGGSHGSGAGQLVSADSALKISAVWACVKLVSEAVGAMPVKVWRLNSDGTRTADTSHWLYNLLNFRPNRYQTRNEFLETLVINLMIAGNSYCLKLPNAAGRIVALMPMMATQTEVIWKRGQDRSYVFTDGKDAVAFPQEKVWHVMAMPSSGIVGLSPIQYGARTMGIAIAAEDRVGTMAANGFKPTGVLMVDRVLKPEQRTAIRENFADLHEGQGDPLKVLEAGMKYQQVSISPKDAQLLESRQFSVEDICRILGVPPILVHHTTGTTAWGTGIGEIKEGFYTLNLRPLLEKLESSMERWLLAPEEQKTVEVEFDFSSMLRGNEAQRIEMMAKAVAGNLKTIDEARAEQGDPPLPGGVGSVMYAQSQMIPIGSRSPDNPNQVS